MSFFISENQRATPTGENQKGFTLVELMVAILLLTVGIFAVIAMQTTSMNANSIAMKLSVSSSLAQEALEDILSWPPDATNLRISVVDEPYDLDPNSPANSATIPGAGIYNASYTTTIGPATGVTRVTVTVTEVTVTGSGRSVTVTGFKRTL